MKKLSVLILAILCLGLTISHNSQIKEVYAGANEMTAPTQKYDAEYDVSYYSDIVGKKDDLLLEGLATISQANHKTFTSYDDIRGGIAYSDEDPSNPNNVLDVYTGWSVDNTWNSGSNWNREHMWPQSLSNGLYGTSGAGSDIHHIRPSIPSINGSRGNKPYGDVANTEANKYYYNSKDTGCYTTTDAFEPSDWAKGDTARIIMYMYMHYSTEVSANSSFGKAGKLYITSVIYTSQGTESAAWDLLLSWNELDPVSTFESNRNDYCASVTGVRNPFIDHPEFATMIWDSSYSGNGAIADSGNQEEDDYLSLPSSTLLLKQGNTYQLSPDTNMSNPTYQYSSSNTSVASVSSSGLITALSAGQTTITVSCNGLSASLLLTVNESINNTTQTKYTVASKSSVNVENELEGTSATYSQTYSTTSQLTAGNSATLTLYGFDGYIITGFVLSMKSNSSKGAGSLAITSGSTTIASIADSKFNTASWNGAWSTTYVDIDVPMNNDYTVGENENITITITASENSLYITSFIVKYSVSSDNPVIDPIENIKDEIGAIETKAQMNLGYYYSVESNYVEGNLSVSTSITSTYMNDSSINYANLVGLDENVFNVTAEKGSAGTYPYIHKDGHVRIYAYRSTGAGNTFIVSLKDKTNNINKISFTASSGTYLTVMNSTNTVILQNEDGSYTINDYQFKIKNTQNTGSSNINAQLKTMNITYGTEKITYSKFSNVAMRFVGEIPTEFVKHIDSFGITLLVNGKTVDIPISKFTQEENGISFAVVINNITNFDVEICATAYVMIDGEKVNLKSKTYSVETIIEKYLTDTSLNLSNRQIGALEAFKELNNLE